MPIKKNAISKLVIHSPYSEEVHSSILSKQVHPG